MAVGYVLPQGMSQPTDRPRERRVLGRRSAAGTWPAAWGSPARRGATCAASTSSTSASTRTSALRPRGLQREEACSRSGLGFGTLGRLLARAERRVPRRRHRPGPVETMREPAQLAERARRPGGAGDRARAPVRRREFDASTRSAAFTTPGDLPKSVSGGHRVFAPGGRAIVMLYNRHSLRQVMFGACACERRAEAKKGSAALRRQRGRAMPLRTPTSSRAATFDGCSATSSAFEIDAQNFDAYRVRPSRASASWELVRVVGLDLYIVADDAGVATMPRFSVVVPTRVRPTAHCA